MNERRQLPRWEVKKEIKVWIPMTQGFGHCVVEDMHLKGMRVSFNKPLPRQESVGMSFAIGDGFDFIKIEAKIPWSKEDQGRYVYGLLFSKVDDSNKDRLSQYMITNADDQFKNKWWA